MKIKGIQGKTKKPGRIARLLSTMLVCMAVSPCSAMASMSVTNGIDFALTNMSPFNWNIVFQATTFLVGDSDAHYLSWRTELCREWMEPVNVTFTGFPAYICMSDWVSVYDNSHWILNEWHWEQHSGLTYVDASGVWYVESSIVPDETGYRENFHGQNLFLADTEYGKTASMLTYVY